MPFIYSVGPLPAIPAPVAVQPGAATVPPIAPGTFDILVTFGVSGQTFIGFTGGQPTSWIIIAGDAPHYFDTHIQVAGSSDPIGSCHLRTNQFGPQIPPPGVYSLTLQASNASGFSNVVISVTVQGVAVPVVSGFAATLTQPLTAGPIGTLSATNNPTSWAINPANANFSVTTAAGSTTTLSLTAQGVSLAVGVYSLTVQATNGGGTSTQANNVSITVQAAVSNVDGFALAPAGTGPNGKVAPQYPTLLAGLSRPSWRVAGVDYGVGYPDGQVFKVPGVDTTPAGCTINASTHEFTISGSNIVVDGWDFGNGGGWHVGSTGTNNTIQNCKFLVGANLRDPIDMASGTIQYCVIDGGAGQVTQGPNGPFGATALNLGSGDVSVFYCWIKNSTWDHVDLHGSGSNNFTMRFNLWDNNGRTTDPNAHNDWCQTYSQFSGDPGYGTITAEYNTNRQSDVVGTGTQGWTLQGNNNVPLGNGINIVNFNNNCSVDTSGGMNYYFAYNLGFIRSNYSVNNNYARVPEATGTAAFRNDTGSFTPRGTISGTGNTNMLTGTTPANWNFGGGLQAPVITNTQFTYQIGSGAADGNASASNSPTAWTLGTVSPSSAQTWFAISNSGAVTLTATGQSSITAGTYVLNITASNAVGPSQPGTHTIIAQAQALPVVTPQTITVQEPLTLNQAIGSAMVASNGPITSWTITAGNTGSAWSIDPAGSGTPGQIRATSVAAAFTTAQSFSLTVRAANAAGAATATANITVNVASSVNDGAASAPFPGLNNGNYANWFTVNTGNGPGGFGHPSTYVAGPGGPRGRTIGPSWNVAGVDYYVGHPTNIALKNVGDTNLSVAGTGMVRTGFTIFIRNVTNPIIDGWDFTQGGGHELIADGPITGTLTIKNCKFVALQPQDLFKTDSSGFNILIQNCTFDWNNQPLASGGANAMRLSLGDNNTCTMEYCILLNTAGDWINYGGASSDATACKYFFRYCLMANAGLGATAHGDWISTAGGTFTNAFNIEFCTLIQNATVGGPQGVSIGGCGFANNSSTENFHILNGKLDHCVIGPHRGMNFCIAVSSKNPPGGAAGVIVPVQVTNNYWDTAPDDANFSMMFFDPGSPTAPLGTCSGVRTPSNFVQSNNVDLRTGGNIVF